MRTHKVVFGLVAVVLALTTGCAFDETLSPLDQELARSLPEGSCSEAGLNFNTIGENQKVTGHTFYAQGNVGDGASITARGTDACIFIGGSVGANVTLTAIGKNATIIVYGPVDPTATARAEGPNALVRIDDPDPAVASDRYTTSTDQGGRVYIDGVQAVA